jgi:hypothetical protein
MSTDFSLRANTFRKAFLATALGATALSLGGTAFAWDYNSSGLSIRIDSTVSVGAGLRTSSPDSRLLNEGDGGPRQVLPAPVGGIAFLQAIGAVPAGVLPPGVASITPIAPTYGGGINSAVSDRNINSGEFYSGIVKATHEIEMKYGNFTFFARPTYFYDAVADQDSGSYNSWSDNTRKITGKNFKVLDSFVDAKFNVAGRDASVRLGKQVINWGESTFILNGINAFSPIDVSAFRRPGSEIKEAIAPQWMASAQISLVENLSLSGWYQLKWEPYQLDAAETFFNGSSASGEINTAGAMGTRNPFNGPPGAAWLGVGGGAYAGTFRRNCALPQNAAVCASSPYVDYRTPIYSNSESVRLSLGDTSQLQRLYDKPARDDGQFGLSLKWYAEELNNTEFGLYYANYHSRLPIYTNASGTPSVTNNYVHTGLTTSAGTRQAYFVGYNPVTFLPAGTFPRGVTDAIALTLLPNIPLANPLGVTFLNPATGRQELITNLLQLNQARAQAFSPLNMVVTAGGVATLKDGIEAPAMNTNGKAFLYYPEDIKEWGLSFNTTVLGIGLQGEMSYKKDEPLQINDLEIILAQAATACSFEAGFGFLNSVLYDGAQLTKPGNPSGKVYKCDPTRPGNQVIQGHILRDSISAQFGTTQTFQPSVGFVRALGANQAILVTEFGMVHYENLPHQWQLRLNPPNLQGSSSPLGGILSLDPLFSGYPTANSGGYVVLGQLNYDNVFGTAVTLNPTVAFRHDVFGISPGPNGNYIRSRKSMSVALDGSYLGNWKGSLAYVNNFGGGLQNRAADKDFLSFSVAYSF